MKVGEPVKFLRPPEDNGRIYDHPMDGILREIQERRQRPSSDIKLSHAFFCVAVVIFYLAFIQ